LFLYHSKISEEKTIDFLGRNESVSTKYLTLKTMLLLDVYFCKNTKVAKSRG